MDFEMQNNTVKNYFSDLYFDEAAHAYLVNGKRLRCSVSAFIKSFSTPVDFNVIAIAIDKKNGFPMGTTGKVWQYKADEACARGTKAHFFGETYAYHRNLRPETPLEKAIVSFFSTMPPHIIPAFTELNMYHKKYLFGGTADLILYNTITEKYIICDYKTNQELFKTFKENTLMAPFTHLADTKFNKYQLQFGYYQILLEQTGVKVENRFLIWLKDSGTFEMLEVEDYTKELLNVLENE